MVGLNLLADFQVQEVEKKTDCLEQLEEEYQKRVVEIAELERGIARLKEQVDELAVEQTQTQAPDHSSELAALRLQKRDAEQTVRNSCSS